MKALPSLYKNENIKYKDNNKSNCIVKEYEKNNDIIDIIDSIFNTKGFPFDKKVIIKTKNKIFKTYLVTRNDNKVTTLNDEVILIDDILSIERI